MENKNKTTWKYIDGFDQRYVISNTGKVYDRNLSKLMKLHSDGKFELYDKTYITKSSIGRTRRKSQNALMKKYFPNTIDKQLTIW